MAITQVVQEMPQSTTDRNTGFPEPLSPDRNTTLPHPEADTSKGATIEGPDIALSRTQSRSRSFLGRHYSSRHSHKVSNGGTVKIVDEKTMYDNIQYADGSKETRSSKEIEQALKGGNEDGAQANRGSSELGRGQDEDDDRRDEFGYKEGERKKGILRKTKLHKF